MSPYSIHPEPFSSLELIVLTIVHLSVPAEWITPYTYSHKEFGVLFKAEIESDLDANTQLWVVFIYSSWFGIEYIGVSKLGHGFYIDDAM